MKKTNANIRKGAVLIVAAVVCVAQMSYMTGCGASTSSARGDSEAEAGDEAVTATETATVSATALLDTADMFTERDKEQQADTSEAVDLTLKDGQDIDITQEGVYVITGEAKDSSIKVDAPKDAKVQLVLDNVNITNTDAPAVYVMQADKVFVTTTDSDNSLEVTGTYQPDGDTNLDAVIFAKDDLVLNGVGTLDITGNTGNGIACKDSLKITGGTCSIKAQLDCLEANDSIAVCGGRYTLDAGEDGLHCENTDDLTLGYIYFADGDFTINAGDDGIRGTTVIQMDGGCIDIPSSVEGIEAAGIMINDGTVNIYASDDGINASAKSTECELTVVFNGGNVTISVGPGDTDGVDSNGNIVVNGGTIDVTAQLSSFDYETTAKLNGGTVIVNGEEVSEIPESMMGGGHGGPRGSSDQAGKDGYGKGRRPDGAGGMPPDGQMTRPEGTPPAGDGD